MGVVLATILTDVGIAVTDRRRTDVAVPIAQYGRDCARAYAFPGVLPEVELQE
jgi:hypothetical protein